MNEFTKEIIDTLQSGRFISFYSRGRSMEPRLKDGGLLTLAPVKPCTPLKTSDAVFCKVRDYYVVHLIGYCAGDQYLIADNHGNIDGWINRKDIYGLVYNGF